MEHVMWCSGCNSEPAVEMFEIEWDGIWRKFPVGAECLTRAHENVRIEE